MSERKPKPLAILEAKTRQLMLMVGFGFTAFIAGQLLSSSLLLRVRDRMLAADSPVAVFLVGLIIWRLWILVVFPVLVNLASRFIDLPLWRMAIIGALTGDLFYAAIQVASTGADEAFGDWVQNGVRVGTLVCGICFTVWAGKRGRAWAEARQKTADQAAAARKSQYDEFLAQSTALAERREAAPIVAPGALVPPVEPAAVSGTEPAPAPAPVPLPPEPKSEG